MIEKLRTAAGLFGMITTSVFLVSTAYITFFLGINAAISVKVLWQVMAVSALCSAVGLFLPNTKKEPSKKAMLIRNILCFAYENAVVLTCAFLFGWINAGEPKMTAAMELCIITVFGTVYLASYLSDRSDAEKMNRVLKKKSSFSDKQDNS